MKSAYDQDWSMLRHGVEELKDYLLSSQLYWPLPAPGGFSKTAPVSTLTPGNVLLSLRRLQVLPLDAGERAQVAEWTSEFEQTRERWRAAWSRKSAAEFSARLNPWQSYVNELAQKPSRGKNSYASSVRGRCILELLLAEMDHRESGAEEAVSGLDVRLRNISSPGPFVWEPEVEPAFPSEQFWFLYLTFD